MNYFVFLISVILLFALPTRAAEPAFFADFADLPLMAGMEELEGQSLVFDKPQGRIIESVAVFKKASAQEVLAFYAQTLPQMGWRMKDQKTFLRGRERLTLSTEQYEGHDFLRVRLTPR